MPARLTRAEELEMNKHMFDRSPAGRLDALERGAAAWRPMTEAMEKRIKELETALKLISDKRYSDRNTVTEANAWPAFQRVNRQLVEVFDIAKAALEGSNNPTC